MANVDSAVIVMPQMRDARGGQSEREVAVSIYGGYALRDNIAATIRDKIFHHTTYGVLSTRHHCRTGTHVDRHVDDGRHAFISRDAVIRRSVIVIMLRSTRRYGDEARQDGRGEEARSAKRVENEYEQVTLRESVYGDEERRWRRRE